MEGAARARGGLLSGEEGGSHVVQRRQEERRMKKGWEKVRKGHLESSRKRLPLLSGRRYIASTPKGVRGDVAMGGTTCGERGEGGSASGAKRCKKRMS